MNTAPYKPTFGEETMEAFAERDARIEKLTRERDALKARLDVYVTGVDYHMARCPSFRQTCSAAFAPSALADTAGPERGEGER